jgi:very-short-patch-repair endonuclease
MSLDSHQALFLFIGSIATIAWLIACFGRALFQNQHYYAKRIITPFEQKMFLRLNETFPHHHVLAQVAFSALIDCDQLKLRSKFNRKVTDFVLLNQQLEVIAIIELDDPSHIGKEHIDAQRDAMLAQAGYRIYRYTDIPSCRELRKEIAA